MTLDYHVQWLAFDGLATAGQQVVGMGVYTVVLGPVVWPMQARMLAVLKRNIERAASARLRRAERPYRRA